MSKLFGFLLVIVIATPVWPQVQFEPTQSPTPQETTTQTPSPTEPAAQTVPQSAQSEANNKDKQKLDSLAQDAKTQTAEQDQKITELQTKLAAVQAQLAALPNVMSVQALSGRVTALEQLQKAQQDLVATQNKQAIINLSRQYQAGYAVLSLMDDNAHRLDFAFQLSASIGQFQDAVNPMNNKAFTADVDALLAKQSTGVIGSITSNPSVQALAAANPYVSLGVSIASYFTSKVSTDKKDPKL